jgi:hypothetical protein
MPYSVYLNETALDTLGIYVERVTTWRDAPAREYPTVAIPGRQGVVFAADPTTAPRTLRISAMIHPAALTLAARRTAEDQLKALAYRALIKVIEDDGVNAPRQIDGVCTSCTITPRRHPVQSLVSDAELSILCPDPTWSDVVGQVIGFTSTATAVPLGTAVSGGIVRIAAPPWSADVDIPVLHYVNAGGVTIQSMTFGGVTSATDLQAGLDYLEVDLDRATVTRYDSGVASNGIALLTAGDFFSLDPMDGDTLNASYPMLKVTATGGTPSGQWLGARRWL